MKNAEHGCIVWETAAGLRAAIRVNAWGQWCGYVEIPTGHPARPAKRSSYYATECDENDPIDVHGGITYGGDRLREGEGHYWIGFDTSHAEDMPDFGGTPKSDAFVRAECEKLARQLLNMVSA